jgi:hypothetical protein
MVCHSKQGNHIQAGRNQYRAGRLVQTRCRRWLHDHIQAGRNQYRAGHLGQHATFHEENNGMWRAVLGDHEGKEVISAWGTVPYCQSAILS